MSVHWQPVEDLLVRGSWGNGFRAPSINELYQGIAIGRPSINDPCSATSVAFQSASVQAACHAAGVPTGFKNVNAQAFLSTGGNVNLKPETSRNKKFSPAWCIRRISWKGFDTSLDWYNIRIENAISSRSAQGILDNCYIYGIAQSCALITRDATGATFANPGEITGILGLNQNFIGGLEVEGYDFAVNYRLKTDNWGNFKFNWGNAYISYYGDVGQPKRGQVNGDGDISLGNTIGRGKSTIGSSTGATQFRLRSQLNTAWAILATGRSLDQWST